MSDTRANSERYEAMMRDVRAMAGDPPRHISFLEQFYWRMKKPAWLRLRPRDLCHGIYKDQAVLRTQGKIVWAHIIQANSLLFQAGPTDSPAMIVYSPRREFDGHVPVLKELAGRLYALKGTKPTDREARQFADEITSEMARTFAGPVPKVIAGKLNVVHSTVMVARKHLPDGYLTQSYFPILICPEMCNHCMILPSRYWPAELQT